MSRKRHVDFIAELLSQAGNWKEQDLSTAKVPAFNPLAKPVFSETGPAPHITDVQITKEMSAHLRRLQEHEFPDELSLFNDTTLRELMRGSLDDMQLATTIALGELCNDVNIHGASRHIGYYYGTPHGGPSLVEEMYKRSHNPLWSPMLWGGGTPIIRREFPRVDASELEFKLKDTDIPWLRITAPNPGVWQHKPENYPWSVQSSFLSCVSQKQLDKIRATQYERWDGPTIMRAMLGSKSNTAMAMLQYEAHKKRHYFNVGTVGHVDHNPDPGLCEAPHRLKTFNVVLRNLITKGL